MTKSKIPIQLIEKASGFLTVKPKGKRKKPNPIEEKVQIAIFNQLRPMMQMQGHKKFTAFHVPNGGKRNIGVAKKMKAMGTTPGVMDIILLIPGNGKIQLQSPDQELNNNPAAREWMESVSKIMDQHLYPPRTVFIEVKAGGGTETDSQGVMAERLKNYGFDVWLIDARGRNEYEIIQDGVRQMCGILRNYGVA